MRAHHCWFIAGSLALLAAAPAALTAQEPESQTPCRVLPCAIVVDWTRAGGVAAQTPDRRYGNPTHLEEKLRARLNELGYQRLGGDRERDLRFMLQPTVRNAMCDQMAGTSTDMSCRAVVEVEVRVEGPDELTRGVDLPGRIRNRCPSDQVMPIDRFAAFVGDWIAYAVEGKSKGERRPAARC